MSALVFLLAALLEGEPAVRLSGSLTAGRAGVGGVALLFVEPGGTRTVETTTDGDGRYEVSLPEAGSWGILVLSKKRLPTATFTRRLDAGTQTADLALQGDGVVTGRVVREDGRPLDEEDIQLFLRDQAARGAGADRITGTLEREEASDFRFFGLPPGTYTVTARTSLNELVDDGGAVAVITEGSPTASVEVRLRPSAFLLRLLSPGGDPVAKATVVVNGTPLAERDPGVPGVFSLERLAPGTELEIEAPRYEPICHVLTENELPVLRLELEGAK